MSLRRFYASAYDNNSPSLVASVFSLQCLAAFTSTFLHAAVNLYPPSATFSIHTSAFNPVASQSSAMTNARTLLCTQSAHYFSLPAPSSPHCTIKVSEHDSLRRPPIAHSDEHPAHKKCFPSYAMLSYYSSHTGLSRGYGCTRSSDGLVSCYVPQ